MRTQNVLITIAVVCLTVNSPVLATIRKVPLEYPTIQAGIDVAVNGDTVMVAEGTYTGTGNKNLDFRGKAITVQSTDPEDSDVVASTVINCQGSYSDPHRGFYFHSGEGQNSIVSGFTIRNGYAYDNNDGHAYGGGIYCSGSSPTITNCLITDNQAHGRDGEGYDPPVGGEACGGGIYCTSNSNPTIINCTVSNNVAAGGNGGWFEPKYLSGEGGLACGGGIFCTSSNNPLIINCIISNNTATGGDGAEGSLDFDPTDGGNADGGGIYCRSSSSLIIEKCNVTGNTALGGIGGFSDLHGFGTGGDGRGGGIFCLAIGSKAIIRNCTIGNNEVEGGDGVGGGYGGGICFNSANDSTIENCSIYNNRALGGHRDIDPPWLAQPVVYFTTQDSRVPYELYSGGHGGDGSGGGIYCDDGSKSTIENCTIYLNTVLGGPGGYGGNVGEALGGGVYTSVAGHTTLTNSIVWANVSATNPQIYGSGLISYSDVQGGWPGEGNISANPCFVTGPEGHYYLSQIAAGQAVDSPCVDAGSDTAANLGMDIFTTRTDHICDAEIVDIGYHYFISNPTDIDRKGSVDFIDYAILTSQWKQVPGVPSADIAPPGGDGVVDGKDLAFLVKYWLWVK